MFRNIRKIIVIVLLVPVLQSQLWGQVRFDYITDWSHILLTNINRFSETSYKGKEKKSNSDITNLSFSSFTSFNDFYRERIGELQRHIFYLNQMNLLKTRIRLYDQRFFIGAAFGFSQKEMNYDIKESQSIQMKNGYKIYKFFISTSIFEEYLTLSGSIGRKIIDDIEFIPWNFGVIFKPTKSISLAYHRYEDFFRWEYHLRFDNPSERLLSDEFSQLDEFHIEIRFVPELKIIAGMQNNYINNNRKVDNPESILIPTGTHYQRSITIQLFPENQFALNLNYYNRSHGLMGYFYNSYQVFGKITEQTDQSELYQSEIIYRNQSQKFGLKFARASGMMRMNGHVETWPFTSTLVDLLGMRYNLKSDLEYKLFRVGVSYSYTISDWHVSFNSSYERLDPGGRAKTWEPEVFAFGIKNMNVYTLSTNPRNGVYLGIHLSKSFSQLFRLGYEFHQYVPLELSSSGKPENNTGLKQYDTSLQKSVYGGGKHQLFMQINL